MTGFEIEPTAPSDAELLRRVLSRLSYQVLPGNVPPWIVVMDACGITSEAAKALCARLSIEEVTRK